MVLRLVAWRIAIFPEGYPDIGTPELLFIGEIGSGVSAKPQVATETKNDMSEIINLILNYVYLIIFLDPVTSFMIYIPFLVFKSDTLLPLRS